MILTVPYPPPVNRMYRSVVIGGHARVLLSKEARQYKRLVSEAFLERVRRDGGCVYPIHAKPAEVVLNIALYRPRRVGDIDGALKGLLDALQGYLFENDSQVCVLHVWRGDDKVNPRAEVCATRYVPAAPR